MRFILSALAIVGGPAGAFFASSAALSHALAGLSAVLPDPATAAVMCAGLGLVAGARRARSQARAD